MKNVIIAILTPTIILIPAVILMSVAMVWYNFKFAHQV